ncbi:HesA/MoeB/ThiF family protein [Pseudaestuariivita rosea]|uniref:HesA/MoeB/ThiF family protein n=1 Tax=Pseudaestuariivita rosea TaxID=2763263 RepID=UPI001ABA5F17|nr:HesA/MoeB/ThiF family protein [Pseudaestuariivita rosea]
MIFVFVMAGVLWGIGALMKTPHQARWIMIGLLFTGVMALQIALPDGHPIREGTGGSPQLWLLLGGFVGVALLYRRGLMWIRARTNPVSADPPPRTELFAEVELERYARHIVLREIGGLGQKQLKEAKVLVIGAGGLGAPALMYLSAAGVGTIGLIDDDTVENTNLQRQIIHRDAGIGMPKVFSAETAMKAQNPYTTVRPYNRRLTEDIAQDLIAEYDIVLDGTDNFDTRYLVNRTCVALGKPLIAAALTQWEGQISTYNATVGPCYQCIFPKPPDPSLAPSCAEAGVLGPLPGVLGTMMAVEAIKEITGAGQGLTGQMLIYDGLYAETRKIKLKKRTDCPVCGG